MSDSVLCRTLGLKIPIRSGEIRSVDSNDSQEEGKFDPKLIPLKSWNDYE
jgi:hypothetical protein